MPLPKNMGGAFFILRFKASICLFKRFSGKGW